MKGKIFKLLSGAKHKMLPLAMTIFSVMVHAQTTYTFNYTGGTQTITLPAGIYSIQCWGADGGSVAANTALPGKGGYSSGTFTLSSPTTYTIYVGGKGNGGGQPLGGYNSGNGLTKTNVSTATGGGGATDVRVLVNSLFNRIIVAGGGGGQGTSTGTGGHGGGLTGQNGQGTTNAGVGGTQNAPGLYPPGGDAKPAAFGEGGDGPAGTTGGQGGGGWYGGSFGTRTNGGGAGGSGYVLTAGSFTPVGYFATHANYYFGNAVTLRADQGGFVLNPDATGNGKVLIKELCSITLGTNLGSNLICNGSAVTLTTDAISNYTWSTGSNASSITVSPSVTTTYSLTAMSPSLCMTSAAITITVSNSAPTLSVSVSSPTVCLGNTVSISASGALTYSFSGGISNGVAFTPSATSAYTIIGQNGCGTASSVSTITIAPLPVTALANPSVVCAGNTASLSGAGATTYTWSPGNIVGTSIIVSPQVNTTYTVVGETGSCIGTNTLVVSANPNPTITTLASNSIVCGGESVTLTANGALSYTWQPGNLTGSSIVVNPSSPTSYAVTGNNSFGCTSTVQQPVIAYASPTIVLNPFSTTICAGGTAVLNASGANTYTWSTGPNTSSISVNPTSTTVYTVSGTNTLTQCSSSNTVEVNVFVPNMTVTSPTAVCIGGSATLTASGANTYQWNTGGFGPSLVVTPNSTTSYTVTGVTNSGNVSCSSSAVTTVSVNPLPTITAVASRSNICKNESTLLTASGGLSYLWSNSATTASTSLSPTINTTYSVEGTDANGCKNSASIFIRVYACVGLNEINGTSPDILIYPNPSSGTFRIESAEPLELLLLNELGQLLMDLKLSADNNFTVKIENLSSGIYLLQSKDPEKNITKKIIVQK